MSAQAADERYVRASGRVGSTRLYDRSIALTMREERWRPLLVERVLASVPERGRVVDVGAGTGTLAIAIAGARPDVEVIGIDGDPEVLALAQAKPGAERVHWRSGLAGDLELPDTSADAVVMSLVLHHLPLEAKRRALRDVARVLRPGGAFHVADFGRPATPLLRTAFLALQALDGFEGTRDHAAGRVGELLEEAGFSGVDPYRRMPVAWGTLELRDVRITGRARTSG
jgi:SAM-dependent methyltransferase